MFCEASRSRCGGCIVGFGLDEHDAAIDGQRLKFDREIGFFLVRLGSADLGQMVD